MLCAVWRVGWRQNRKKHSHFSHKIVIYGNGIIYGHTFIQWKRQQVGWVSKGRLMQTRPRIPRREFLNKHSNSSHFPFSISFYINNISVDRVKYPLYLLCALIFCCRTFGTTKLWQFLCSTTASIDIVVPIALCVFLLLDKWKLRLPDCLCVCMYVNSIITCEMSKLKTRKEYLGGCNGPGGREGARQDSGRASKRQIKTEMNERELRWKLFECAIIAMTMLLNSI